MNEPASAPNLDTFKPDRTGFPMIKVDSLNAYVHFWPLTKLQFEIFICSRPDNRFSEEVYNELITLNPRISPNDVNDRNFWRAFITGLRPTEAELIAQWYGDDYEVPTLEEWHEAFIEFEKLLPIPTTLIEQHTSTNARIRLLTKKLLQAGDRATRATASKPQLVDQMLMRGGVVEWVRYDHDPSWAGKGRSHQGLYSMLSEPRRPAPDSLLRDPKGDRSFYYGTRLIRRL